LLSRRFFTIVPRGALKAKTTLNSMEKFMKQSHSDYYDDVSVQERASNLLDKTKWLREIYDRASKYKPDLVKECEPETFRATGRVLAWLDLAERKSMRNLATRPLVSWCRGSRDEGSRKSD
jgi:hypothetical protein